MIALELTSGPYSGSWKEPEVFVRVKGHALPTPVVLTGWSELTRQLHDDMDLLLVGGNSKIKIVVTLTWTRLSDGHVSGTIELFKTDHRDIPRREQIEVRPD